MTNTAFHFLTEASDLARGANRCTFWAQQHKAESIRYESLIQDWEKALSLSDFLTFGVGWVMLMTMDLHCLMPLYRQVSQIISGNPDLLPWYIGIGVNTVALVCSHRLSKCAPKGPFYDWEVWKNRDKPLEMAKYTVTQARKSHIRHFTLLFFLYVTLLFVMLWMRSILIQKSLTSDLENLLTILGLCFALLAVLVGVYLIPLLQYGFWKFGHHRTVKQVNSYLRQISDIDQQIYLLWVHAHEPVVITKDIKDALIRYSLRTNDLNYLDPISDAECDLMNRMLLNRNLVNSGSVLELTD